jgi:hypothetical protein
VSHPITSSRLPHTYDITVYPQTGVPAPDGLLTVQRRYLVHGYDDAMWTDDLEEAVEFLKESIEQSDAEFGR